MSPKVGVPLVLGIVILPILVLIYSSHRELSHREDPLSNDPVWFTRISSSVRTYSSLDKCIEEQKTLHCDKMFSSRDKSLILLVSSDDYVSIPAEKRKQLMMTEQYLMCLEPNLGCSRLGRR